MTLLDHVRAHLIAQGLVRDPRVAGALPPCWRHPAEAKAPGEGNNPAETGTDAVVSLFFAGGLTTRRFDSARRRDIVDVWIRATTPPRAITLGADIRGSLIDKVNWQLGGLTVIESLEWRPLQPLPDDLPGVFTFFAGVLFETYAS